MKKILFLIAFPTVVGGKIHCQTTNLDFKHRNSIGISYDLGGKMEKAPDIFTFSESESKGAYAKPVGKNNFGFSLFWEHQWNFYRNHGLLFGLSTSITAFDYDIAFKNPELSFVNEPTKEYILGYGSRNSFVSLDLPLYYTFTIKTKIGVFNPFIGINIRNIAYINNAGRNYGGISGVTSEIENGDTIYHNEYFVKFGTTSFRPTIMPTFGIRYSKTLKNGSALNIHITRKKMLYYNSNSPEIYINDYDNIENGYYYFYYQLSNQGDYYYNSLGELVGPKMSLYYRINMSSFNFGVSYSFK